MSSSDAVKVFIPTDFLLIGSLFVRLLWSDLGLTYTLFAFGWVSWTVVMVNMNQMGKLLISFQL